MRQDQVMFILMKAGVTGPEIDDCMDWAFGKDAWHVPIYPDWTNRWNKLHRKLFYATPRDKFLEFIYVVGWFYLQEKKKEGSNGKEKTQKKY
jgi:hypothetical protein